MLLYQQPKKLCLHQSFAVFIHFSVTATHGSPQTVSRPWTSDSETLISKQSPSSWNYANLPRLNEDDGETYRMCMLHGCNLKALPSMECTCLSCYNKLQQLVKTNNTCSQVIDIFHKLKHTRPRKQTFGCALFDNFLNIC